MCDSLMDLVEKLCREVGDGTDVPDNIAKIVVQMRRIKDDLKTDSQADVLRNKLRSLEEQLRLIPNASPSVKLNWELELKSVKNKLNKLRR